MPRKKAKAAEAAPTQNDNTSNATAVIDPPAMSMPAYIDGAPVDEHGNIIKSSSATADAQMLMPQAGEGKRWGDPYKALFTAHDFEMGEHRRFKQRVFKFKEKPSEEVLAALKDAGFSYRAHEKAWTIHADADTRKLSDELAREFSGQGQGMLR